MRRGGLSLLLAAAATAAAGQTASAPEEKPSHPPHAIQDNSFLVEEAYNQEEGIVQHINLFQRNARTGEWIATFTQEYPFPGIRHQLSYTIPYQRIEAAAGRVTGLGDLAINYRYQWIGNDEAAVAIAPRLTLFLPSGNERRGLGAGSTGVQLGIPASTVLSADWIAHWNAGATVTPSARNEHGQKANTFGYYLGGSVIWLGRSFDVLLETVWASAESVAAPHRVDRATSFFVSPGVRWSYDFPNGLQIVPGIGVPIGLGSSRGQYSILLYLSFEHPFRRATD
jgi:outer membrane putative beta-barrel porin/alpha-amylase